MCDWHGHFYHINEGGTEISLGSIFNSLDKCVLYWMKTQLCSCPTQHAYMCIYCMRVKEKVREYKRWSAALGFSCSDVPSSVFSLSLPSKNISRAQRGCVLLHYSDLAIDFLQTFVVQFGFEEKECLVLILVLFLRTESLRRHWAADPVPPCSYHWEN